MMGDDCGMTVVLVVVGPDPNLKSKIFPSLNQTGESSSLDLILGYFHVAHIFFRGARQKLGMVFRGP